VLRASATIERSGIPAVAIVSSGFMRQAEVTKRATGVKTALAEYPGVIPTDTEEEFAAKVTTSVVPRVVDGFATRLPSASDAEIRDAEPEPRSLAFTGTLDEVQDYFDDRLWSDGLPIVPPTARRVEEFLSWTDRDPDDVLGVLAPELREATVWSVAVNGVMAGCKPHYMPVLVAAVEAISDPEFRVQDAGATPGWETLLMLSGPIINDLDLNTETGVMRIGRRANSTLGRFARLYTRNVAGFRIPPGTSDKGTIGFTFPVALGENEAICRELGWPTFGQDRGFADDESAVTVQSALIISSPIYSGGSTYELLDPIVYHMATTCGPWASMGLHNRRWHPVLILSPSVARRLAAAGLTKDDIRQHLYENATIEVDLLERHQLGIGGKERTFAELVGGEVEPELAESDDGKRLVPVLLRPEWTSILVAGDPGRNQSKIYVNNHLQGAPVSKAVSLPADWKRRLENRTGSN
jgi:hypothetical protein